MSEILEILGISKENSKSLSREDLERENEFLHAALDLYTKHVKKLNGLLAPEQLELVAIADQMVILKKRLFGRSSEKQPDKKDISAKSNKGRDPFQLLPSLRYPELPLIEKELEAATPPSCRLCSNGLTKMNVTENGEYITLVEKVYRVERVCRHKYRCNKCHGDIYTVPPLPRIREGASMSDEVAIDIAVSKYADHLPVERYAKQMERLGMKDVNRQTLIEQTHFLADYLEPVYQGIKAEVEAASVIHADETPWKMLEGEAKSWQLWGFFTKNSCYYSAEDTRAAKVAEDFLKNCKAEFLGTDAFSGYEKATRGTEIKNFFCNAHARRKFTEAELSYPEAIPVVKLYAEIYEIEREIQNLKPEDKKIHRQERLKPIFDKIKSYIESLNPLPQSSIGKAKTYLQSHWRELTRFLEDGRLPIDNNIAERGLRGPVLGRKNFYGNHSRRGAKTTSVLYSIIESCKLNKINPQKYLKDVVQDLHVKRAPRTPAQYAQAIPANVH